MQDKAEERRHTLCMASDDNAVLRQQTKLMVNSLYNQISLTDAEKQEYFGNVK